MDKYLAKTKVFLEKYVEFVALGLAGLIFLWVLFTYVLSPDVSAEVGARQVGPRDVDEAVLQTSGRALERAIEQPVEVTNVTIADVRGILEEEPLPPLRPDLGLRFAGPVLSTVSPQPPLRRVDETQDELAVDSTPEPGPATVEAAEAFKGYYDVPPAPGETPSPEDLSGVVVVWRIPIDDLRERFNSAALPPRVQNTSLLDVRLVRERKLDDGSFGERTEIGRLRNAEWPALPSSDASVDEKREYLNFVRQSPELISLPPFYPHLAGERVEQAAAGFDPELNPGDFPPPEAGRGGDPRAGRPPFDPSGRRPGAGGRGGPGAPFDPYGPGSSRDPRGDPDRDRYQPPRDPSNPYGPSGPSGGPYRPPFDGSEPEGPEDFGGRDLAPDAFEGGMIPGEFNPTEATGDLEGWAFDETAEPGETYRYNVVYSLRNPLFDTVNVADSPELERQLALTVEADDAWEAAWSEPVEVDRVVRWYMRNAGPVPPAGELRNARFSVFRYQNGQWHEETFTVVAGEPLGGVVDGIDYGTGRYLVDVRRNPATDEDVAVLTAPEARLARHTDEEDETDSYKLFERLAQAADAVAGGR